LAPEVLEGDLISFKADIFALGSILYFMLSGDLPFNDLTLAKIFSRTMKGDYGFFGKKWSDITP
jgi:serine/threonine protein kinase